ncbi:MAG: hypothetical protein V3U57_01060 [Robiginitomaculum sp.]
MHSTRLICRPKLAYWSLIIMLCALFIGALSFAVAGYAFLGFLGDGRSRLGNAQAFLLCFGFMAGFYLPALLVFFMARHVRGFGPKKSIGLAGTILSLPFCSLGGISLVLRLPYWPFGLVAMLIGLGLLFWSISILKNIT